MLVETVLRGQQLWLLPSQESAKQESPTIAAGLGGERQ